MAESPVLDFRNDFSPTIPEITINVQCPSTPGPQLNIKSPELSTASSAEETETTARADGTNSPPPNCAICLGKCKNKCFTDSCMHQFCFKCLLEWSKVKPECPLCKQTFKSIIHNVKSFDQFEEYLVQQPVPVSPNPDSFAPFTIPAHLYPRLPSLYNRPVHIYMDDLAMNTLDLTGTSSSTSNNANANVIRSSSTYYRRILPPPSQLLDMYSQETIQGETGSGSLSQLWRRYVYDRKLFALPLADVSGRFRESSARFYRDNQSQTHRLIQWINRDIVCLLRNTDHDVNSVMEQINTWLLTVNILSPEFRRRLQPFLGTKTAHFIHELNNFARSPYDMIGYDRVVQYSSNSAEEIVIEFSSTSSAGSDVESVYNILSDPGTSRRTSSQPNATQANSGGGFNLYTTSTTASSQASAINLSTHNRGASGESSEGTTTTSTVEVINAPTSERPDNIVLSSTSSDECEFVLEQKPPHLRTPEMVSLNSNSDSDVVFVQETKTTPMPSGIAKWASTNSTRVRRAQRRRANPSLNNTSFSTSNSDSDGFNYADTCPSTSKKIKLDGREENAAAETSTGAPADFSPENDPIPKVKEEFNQGASTSTGLQSRYRGVRPNNVRTRYYRPVNDTSDSDDLDDSRSSASDSGLTTEISNSDSDSDTSWSKSRRKSNKQSLKRSRHRKLSKTTASSRKSRRQLPAPSTKSKRNKRTKSNKTVPNNKSTSSKKKKTIKRSRRKSSKSKSTRTKRRIVSQTSSSDEDEELIKINVDAQPWTSTLSSPISTPHRQSENEPTQSTSAQLRSVTSSPASNSTTTSDANEAAGPGRPSSNATLAAPADSFTPSSPDLPLDADDNPNAKLPIYSDSE
ncbi:E3 ubiquitin-protein ligase Topors-like [Episyrphus balteatus]|uniref:E3 ubiquitin-protein ligase Topors-like n=1 Tax=Episyrphus balteatus TaxID=286459 RepID=UPI0024869129|nr:E3 ubiquitin-protein ligase Topors-like [Episyrphus balteatus]